MESKFTESTQKQEKAEKRISFSPQTLGETVAKNLSTDEKPSLPSKLYEDLKTAVYKKTPDYDKAILTLMELRDRENNIFWRVDSSQKSITGRDLIIRDAREVKKNEYADKYAYQIQAINHIRGALLLLAADKPENKEFYHALITHFIENINSKDLNIKDLKAEYEKFNTVLLQALSHQLKIPFEKASDQLAVAREFANLEMDARDVVTVHKLKGRDNKDVIAIQGEIAMTELTPKLKEKYKNRAKEKWYTRLPDWQKKLVDLSAEKILQGNHIIPTQLRAILIGVRNCFLNVSGIIDEKGKFVNVNDSLHSGTIKYYSKKENIDQEIANLHADQLKQLHNVEHLLTLNSPSNPTGDDKEIVKESSEGMKSVNGYYSNLPLNWLRKITTNEYAGIYHLFKEISNSLSGSEVFEKLNYIDNRASNELLGMIKAYLNPDISDFEPDEQAFRQHIFTTLDKIKELQSFKNNPQALQFVEILKLATKISYLSRNNFNIEDKDNQNLFIGALTNILDSQLSKFLKEHGRTSSACQSGKDRDGILIYTTDLLCFLYAINGFYQVSGYDAESNKNNPDNTIRLALGGHAQFMAGFLGGTLAAFGIKEDSIGAIPEEVFPPEVAKILVLPTAQLNKGLLIDEKLPLNKQYYYSSDLIDFPRQMAMVKHALELQLAYQEYKVSKKSLAAIFTDLQESSSRTKFLASLKGSSDLTRAQVEVLKDLLTKFEEIMNPEKSRGELANNQLKLDKLVEEINNSLKFLSHSFQDSISSPGVTVALLKGMKAHLEDLQSMRTFEKHMDIPNLYK